jgi:exopolysaccharide biosynthesis protein
VEQYGVEVSVNGGFYTSSSGPNDVPLGTAENVLGLAISRGTVVSPANDPTRAAAMLFTTNNQFFFAPTNNPGHEHAGNLHRSLPGDRPLLINGVNVGVLNPNDLDPRTAVGVSQDGRYLFLMTLDGRQPGWSDGADFFNTGRMA